MNLLRKLVTPLGLILVIAMIVGGVSRSARAAERPDVVIAVNKLARGLEPAKQNGNVDVRVYYSIFDTLIRRDFKHPLPDGGARLVPGLATSWKQINPTTLELKLRKGVKFHDGSTFSADDVLATFSSERLRGKDSFFPNGRAYFGNVKDVVKVDPYTVRFITDGPDPVLVQRLSSYASFVISAHTQNKYKKPGDTPQEWLSRAYDATRWNPVGTGPYKFDGYRKDDYIKLASFDDYYGGKPAAKSLTFKAVPEVAARMAGLVSGDFQMVVDVPPDQWDVLKGYKDIMLRSTVLDNTHILVFNTRDKLLSNKKLRHAMSLAIDRKALIDSLWKGQTFTPKGHQLKSFGPMYIPGRAGYTYDPVKARQLVKESGYKGQEISYRLIPGYYLNNEQAAQIIQEMWRKVGINCKLDFVESWKQVRAKGAQVYAWSNTYRVPDPTGAIAALWGPSAAVQTKYKFFAPGEKFNNLCKDLFSTADMKKRAGVFKQMLDIFEDQMPMTMLYNPIETYAMKSNIDFTPYSLYFMDFRPSNFSIK